MAGNTSSSSTPLQTSQTGLFSLLLRIIFLSLLVIITSELYQIRPRNQRKDCTILTLMSSWDLCYETERFRVCGPPNNTNSINFKMKQSANKSRD